MEDKFKADTNNLARDIAELNNLLNAAEKSVEDMNGEINSLNGMWEGTAKENYIADFNAAISELKSVIEDYKKYVNNLTDANEKYIRCFDEVNEIISSMKF